MQQLGNAWESRFSPPHPPHPPFSTQAAANQELVTRHLSSLRPTTEVPQVYDYCKTLVCVASAAGRPKPRDAHVNGRGLQIWKATAGSQKGFRHSEVSGPQSQLAGFSHGARGGPMQSQRSAWMQIPVSEVHHSVLGSPRSGATSRSQGGSRDPGKGQKLRFVAKETILVCLF